MSWPEDTFQETATLWRQTGKDSHGTVTWGTPEACSVVWAQQARMFRDQAGVERPSKAVVLVDRDMAIGDRLVYGTSVSTAPAAGSLPILSMERQRKLDDSGFVWRAIL